MGQFGYANYWNIEKAIYETANNSEQYSEMVSGYQNQIKVLTLGTIGVFSLACVLVRNFCYEGGYSTN